MYGNYFFRRHKLPFVKARFQNVYGPREILGAGRWRGTPHTVWRNVTPTFVFKALHGEALPLINGGKDGRDFIFVSDLAKACVGWRRTGSPARPIILRAATKLVSRSWPPLSIGDRQQGAAGS